MDLHFTFSEIFGGIFFSAFGMYFFKLGKRDMNYYVIATGIALFLFPYFVSNPWLEWPLGAALMYFGYFIRGGSFV